MEPGLQSRLLNKIVEFSIANAHTIQYNFKHFSYIVRRNKILCIGYNNPNKTHPAARRFGHRFCCIHSELDAIVNFPGKIHELRKCKLINVRIARDMSIRMSKPCKFCTKMIITFGFKKVIYTSNKAKFIRLDF